MAYRLSGKILSISPTQTLISKSGNSYDKRDLVVTVIKYDQYTGYPSEDPGNVPKFTFIGQRCQDLDAFKVGDAVTIGFELSGRSYEKEGRTEYLTDVRPVSIYKSNRDFSPAPEVASPSPAPSGTMYQGPSDPFAVPPVSNPIPNSPFGQPFGGVSPANVQTDNVNLSDLGDDLPF